MTSAQMLRGAIGAEEKLPLGKAKIVVQRPLSLMLERNPTRLG